MFPLLWLLLAAPTPAPGMSPIDPAFLSLAREVEAALRDGNPAALDARLDGDQLLQRVTRGLPVSSAFLEELTGEVRERGWPLGRRLLGSGGQGLRVRLLQVRMRGRTPLALFRVLSDSGLNYFEFELGRNARNEAAIVDLYPYLTGERLSESMWRVYLLAAAERGQCLTRRLRGLERDWVEQLPRWRRIERLLGADQGREAVAEMDRLPPRVRGAKFVQLRRLEVLASLDEAEYALGLLAFQKAFPKDPLLDLFALDNPLLRGDSVAMMEAIDRLDRRVADPYLHHLRGRVRLGQDDLEGAKRSFQKALEEEPELLEPHVELLSLAIEEADHAGAVRLLEAMERGAGGAATMRVRIEEGPEARAFLESAEYKAWLDRQRAHEGRDGGSDVAGPAVP
jgi:tetratricopeptide (TPR) repeat protein